MANETNYIVTSLPDYVKENAELISKQIAFGTPTIARLTPQRGIKTSAHINFLGVDVPIQAGRGCGFTPDGTATFTNRLIETALMKKEIKVCPDTLLGKWPEYESKIAADKRDVLPFEAYLVAELIAETNDQLESLVWTGDKSGGDLIDGFLTIADAESTTTKVALSGIATKLGQVRAVVEKLPGKLLKKKVKVFVSPEYFMGLAFELVDANLYHFNPGESVESLILPGTNIEVINTLGLAGESAIYASILENMFYGYDEADAEKRVKIVYDEINDYFAVKFRWNSGVQVAFPDYVVKGNL